MRHDRRGVCESTGPYGDPRPAQGYYASFYWTGFPAGHSGRVLCADRAITGTGWVWRVRDGGGDGCSSGSVLGARDRYSFHQECALPQTGGLDLLGKRDPAHRALGNFAFWSWGGVERGAAPEDCTFCGYDRLRCRPGPTQSDGTGSVWLYCLGPDEANLNSSG